MVASVMSLDPKIGLALQKSLFFEITSSFESCDESLKNLWQVVKRSKVSLLVLCNSLESSYLEQTLDTERKLNVHKTSRTSSENLMHVQFTSCVQGEPKYIREFLQSLSYLITGMKYCNITWDVKEKLYLEWNLTVKNLFKYIVNLGLSSEGKTHEMNNRFKSKKL